MSEETEKPMTVGELIEKLQQFPPDATVINWKVPCYEDFYDGMYRVQGLWRKNTSQKVWNKLRDGWEMQGEEYDRAEEGDEGAFFCVSID